VGECDIVDVLLFQDKLATDAGGSVHRKFAALHLAPAGVSEPNIATLPPNGRST